MQHYDAILLGAGPAGGMCAGLLAAGGWKVLLVEAQQELTNRVCGCYLCPAGVHLLQELNLAGTLAPGARKLEGMILYAPNFQRVETRFPGDGSRPNFGLALQRPDFDLRLLTWTQGQGVDMRMGTRLARATADTHGWRVQLEDGARFSCSLLVGAEGRKSPLARLLGLHLATPARRVAFHLNANVQEPTPPCGEMHLFKDGSYIGLNNYDANRVNISAVGDSSQLTGRTPLEFVRERIEASPHLRRRIVSFHEGEIRATYPAGSRVRGVIGHHAALIGDASGFVDPLTGEGIYIALHSAQALANSALEMGPNRMGRALQAYQNARRRAHRSKECANRFLQFCLRHPSLPNAFFSLLARRRMAADAFVGLVANTYSPFVGVRKMLAGMVQNGILRLMT